MSVKTEQLPHNEGFIISEALGALSREEVTIVQGAAVVRAGTVVEKRDDGKYEMHDPNSSESTAAALGVLCSEVDPTAGDVKGVIIERLAEVRASDLIWIDGISTAQQDSAETTLLTQNIKIRAVAATVSTQAT